MYNSIITTESQPVSSKMDVNMQETHLGFDHGLTEKKPGRKKRCEMLFQLPEWSWSVISSAGVWVLVLGMVTYEQSDVTDWVEWWRLRLLDWAITLSHWGLTVRGSVTIAGESGIYWLWWQMPPHMDRSPSMAELSWASKLPSSSEWEVIGTRCCCNFGAKCFMNHQETLWHALLMCHLMLPNISFLSLLSMALLANAQHTLNQGWIIHPSIHPLAIPTCP